MLLFVACNQQESARPKGILAPNTMADMLTDVHLIEGAKTGKQIMGDSLLVETYYAKVYSKYQVSAAAFNESFAYYTERPEEMNAIYEKVVENLNRMEVRVPKWEKEADSSKTAAHLDSIQAARLKTLKSEGAFKNAKRDSSSTDSSKSE